MDTMFMNSKISKKDDHHRLLLNLTDKVNLKRSDKYFAVSNLSIYCHFAKNVQIWCFFWSIFSPNTRKYGTENLRIGTLFTQ